MAYVEIPDISITGISACVPKKVVNNIDLTDNFSIDELQKVINAVGIETRRIAETDVTASDLCFHAADKLLNDLNIDRNSIDVLIFMSQTGDFKIPATAPILQDRLGLSMNTACFDVGLACSGYVYSLTTIAAYLNLPNVRRVLLLDGETFSKIVNSKDKTNGLLYGDAGTATLLEKKEGKRLYSLLQTDGKGWDAVHIKSGGARNQIDSQSLQEKERADGSIANDTQVYMNGVDVFNFTMRVVPKSIKEILEKSNITLDDIDKIIFHQANKFMTDFFIKKLKIPIEKVPYSIKKFGNTSSSTIPLTIASELKDWKSENKRVLLCGFGAGLSWGSVITDLSDCYISDLIEI
jgi:3-oxoacyl-[acyl-carrier-protein] synthase-3